MSERRRFVPHRRFKPHLARLLIPVAGMTAFGCDKVSQVEPYQSQFSSAKLAGETGYAPPTIMIPTPIQRAEVPGTRLIDCEKEGKDPINFLPGTQVSVIGGPDRGVIVTLRPSNKEAPNSLVYSTDKGLGGRTNRDDDPGQASAVTVLGTSEQGPDTTMLQVSAVGDIDSSPEATCVDVKDALGVVDDFIDELIGQGVGVNSRIIGNDGLPHRGSNSHVVFVPARKELVTAGIP